MSSVDRYRRKDWVTLQCLFAMLLVVGCSKSEGVKPDYDPAGVAKASMAAWDADSDGFLSSSELSDCPAMTQSFPIYDRNQDGKIAEQEIRERIERIKKLPRHNASLSCAITLDGRPLSDATVEFTPEPCMGSSIRSASGKTDNSGICQMSVDDDSMGEESRLSYGVDLGLYRVSIDHEELKVPAKYNVASKLGIEVSLDGLRGSNEFTEFHLKSR